MDNFKALEYIFENAELYEQYNGHVKEAKKLIKDEDVLATYGMNRVIDENDEFRKRLNFPDNRVPYRLLENEKIRLFLLTFIEKQKSIASRFEKEFAKMQSKVKNKGDMPNVTLSMITQGDDSTMVAISSSESMTMALKLAIYGVINDDKFLDSELDEVRKYVLNDFEDGKSYESFRKIEREDASIETSDSDLRKFVKEEVEKYKDSPLQITRNRMDHAKNYVAKQQEIHGKWMWLFRIQHILMFFVLLFMVCAGLKTTREERWLIVKFTFIIIAILFLSSKAGLIGPLSFSLPFQFLAAL